MKKIIFVIILVLLYGCETKSSYRKELINKAPEFSIKVRDGLNEEIIFREPPEELIVLTPDVMKIAIRLGAENKIIAVSELCESFIDAKNKPIIPVFPTLDLDMIKDLSPECLLVSNIYYNDTMVKIIKAQGIKTFYYKVNSLNDFYNMYLQLGILLNKYTEAKTIIDTFKTYINRYSKIAKELTPYTVIVFTNLEEMKTLPPGHFLFELIEKTGVKIINRSEEITVEKLFKLNPDFLLIPEDQTNAFYELRSKYRNLDYLKAVVNHQVVMYPRNEYLEATSDLIETYITLLRLFHPKINI